MNELQLNEFKWIRTARIFLQKIAFRIFVNIYHIHVCSCPTSISKWKLLKINEQGSIWNDEGLWIFVHILTVNLNRCNPNIVDISGALSTLRIDYVYSNSLWRRRQICQCNFGFSGYLSTISLMKMNKLWVILYHIIYMTLSILQFSWYQIYSGNMSK